MKSNEELISIIVPIYNVEKYLRKCVDSLINQTYKNIEIILVDDGSPDNSPKICDAYKEKDNRIVVIHKMNGGLSSARNAGLRIAKGKYIGFVDSDDWVETSMYEDLLSFMVTYDCDLVECGVNRMADDKIEPFATGTSSVLSGKDALKVQLNCVGNNFIPRIAVWSKLFKAGFWANRRFPEGHIHEDYMLTCQALYEASKVGIIRKGLYNHLVTNEESITNSKFSDKDLFLEKQNNDRVEYLKNNGEEKLCFLAKRQYYYTILTLYWKCALNGMKEKEHYLELMKANKNDILNTVPEPYIKQFKLIWLSPKLYILMRRIVQHFKKLSRGK